MNFSTYCSVEKNAKQESKKDIFTKKYIHIFKNVSTYQIFAQKVSLTIIKIVENIL